MVFDHIGAYLYGRELPLASEVGRLAMPLFTLLLAFNLARPGAYEKGVNRRTLARLVVFGGLAIAPYMLLRGATLPQNVMFALALVVGIVTLWRKGSAWAAGLALFIFMAGGVIVEYMWAGVGLGIAAYAYFSRPTIWTGALTLVMMAGLCVLNQNAWALLALPLFAAACQFDCKLPRSPWYWFYGFYPAHLGVLVLLR